MSDNFLRSSLWTDTYLSIVIGERYPAGDPSVHRARKAYEYWTTPGPRPSAAYNNPSRERIGKNGSAHQQQVLDKYEIDASKFDEGYDPADDEEPLVSYKSYRAYSGPLVEAGSDYNSDSTSDDEDEEYGEEGSRSTAQEGKAASDRILANLEQLAATARGQTVDPGQHRRSAANPATTSKPDRKQHSGKQTAPERLAPSRLGDSIPRAAGRRSTIYSGKSTLATQETANNNNFNDLLKSHR